jgi:S1-C subfamily serine protease
MACRCGRTVEDVPLTASVVRPTPPPPPDTTRRDLAIKIGVAIAGVLIAGYLVTRSSSPSPTTGRAPRTGSASGSGATSAAPVAAPRSAASPDPAQNAPGADIVLLPSPTPPPAVDALPKAELTNDLPLPSAMPLESIIEHAMPGVVMVQTDRTSGSGFLVRPDLVVTNAHVTAGYLFVTVTSQSGVRTQGRIAQFSDDFDIALILIDRTSATDAQLPLGESSTLRLGQGIVALGWAQSPEQHTVTRGVITGLRQVGTRPMIQTDAAPHPGDSGGPVLDRAGQVVGITTIRIDGPSSSGGLAIPIDHLKPFLERASSSVLTVPRNSISTIVPRTPDADVQRSTGLERYTADVASMAARADTLDAAWTRYRVLCKVTTVPSGQTREWFALYDPASPLHRAPDACPTMLNDLQRQADAIRAGMLAAGEIARHADVYPGSRRDIRRRFRLDFPDWDR